MSGKQSDQNRGETIGINQVRRSVRQRRRRRKRLARLVILSLFLASIVTGVGWLWSRFTHYPTRTGPTVLVLPTGPRYLDPPGIVLHQSNSPGRIHGKPVDAAWLEAVHAEDHPNWATTFEGKVYHIGYHYVILPDGTIQKGRPDHCPGCHAPHFNNWIGICVVGCFDPSMPSRWKPRRPTPAQIASILSLCERLMSEYHIPPERVVRHSDTKQTWCPGRRFPYRAIVKQLRMYASLHPETHPIGAGINFGPLPLLRPAVRLR